MGASGNSSIAAVALLVLALGLANWPFFTDRLLLVGARRADKHWAWRLLELGLCAGLTILLGFAWESHEGQRHTQGWEFYAVVACLFLTLAFPGFVWRYLRRGRHGGQG